MTDTKKRPIVTFASSHPEVLAAWDSLNDAHKPAEKLCKKAERDFAKQYGLNAKDVQMAVRIGFGDDVPIGFRWPWNAGDKPIEWVWWNGAAKRVLQPRADKRGDAWRARISEIQKIYPAPRKMMNELFGVPKWENGVTPGMALLDGQVWIFFGDRHSSSWDGGTHFTRQPLSAYYAAKETDEAAEATA